MAEFSLDVDGIKENVENSIKEEQEKLDTPVIKNQASNNAEAIFETDLDNPQAREGLL